MNDAIRAGIENILPSHKGTYYITTTIYQEPDFNFKPYGSNTFGLQSKPFYDALLPFKGQLDKCYPIIPEPVSPNNDKKERENKILDVLAEHAGNEEIEAYLNVDTEPKKASKTLIQLAKKLNKLGLKTEVRLLLDRAREIIKSQSASNTSNSREKKIEAQKELMLHIKDNFEKYDKNNDGFVTMKEIEAARKEGFEGMSELSEDAEECLETVGARFDELHFASINPGAGAWHGFSKEDINVLHQRLEKKESLDEIADSLRKQIIKERNLGTNNGFDSHVAFNKLNSQVNPHHYGFSDQQRQDFASAIVNTF